MISKLFFVVSYVKHLYFKRIFKELFKKLKMFFLLTLSLLIYHERKIWFKMSFLKVILNWKREVTHDMQFFSDTNEEKLFYLLFQKYFRKSFLKIIVSSTILLVWLKEHLLKRCWMYGIDINSKSFEMNQFVKRWIPKDRIVKSLCLCLEPLNLNVRLLFFWEKK